MIDEPQIHAQKRSGAAVAAEAPVFHASVKATLGRNSGAAALQHVPRNLTPNEKCEWKLKFVNTTSLQHENASRKAQPANVTTQHDTSSVMDVARKKRKKKPTKFDTQTK